VRLRLLTAVTSADLRGPTACELQTPDDVQATIAKLGPDPLVDDLAEGEERFVAAVRRKPTPIGLLLMDQSVVSGIGNVYRASCCTAPCSTRTRPESWFPKSSCDSSGATGRACS
jgi:endonuclease-8